MWGTIILWILVFVYLSHEATVNLQLEDTSARINYSFAIDYENDRFLLDGKPFQFVSGSFHYFRTPKLYWRDRLRKMRAAGLNAVSTYVEWSLHQPQPNQWNWSGDGDIIEFLNIAREEDLLVLLRPGPYICAERDWGGFPTWLLHEEPSMVLRTNDTNYMRYVEIYLDVILNKIEPYLRGNGGPIIMVQVENEYGSFYACDKDYLNKLRAIFDRHVGKKAVLYTTDGSSAEMVRCGFINGVYPTIDFGSGVNVTSRFQIMRQFAPKGPLVNSEFYPGWLTHWGEPFQRVSAENVVKTLEEMLSIGANVNIYVFCGGTNFKYTSGANGGNDVYSPQITSYDYDAPLTEAGDPTNKYFMIRDVVSKYLPMPSIPVASTSPKGAYGPALLEPIAYLLETVARQTFGIVKRELENPESFEALDPGFLPFVLYETNVPANHSDPMTLTAVVSDRALVYVDNVLCGTLSRTQQQYTTSVESPYAEKLQLLVENQGHLNYGNYIRDFKGIVNATIDQVFLKGWNMTGFRIDDVDTLKSFGHIGTPETGTLRNGPLFLRGNFTVNDKEPLDTFLDTSGWGKGIAFINGHNLGRYWPLAGPQMTLYVPAPFLHTGQDNELIILELEYVPYSRKMKFQAVPNLG